MYTRTRTHDRDAPRLLACVHVRRLGWSRVQRKGTLHNLPLFSFLPTLEQARFDHCLPCKARPLPCTHTQTHTYIHTYSETKTQTHTHTRTPDGLFMYKRLPMGLKTASAVFCRFIDRFLGDLKWDSVLAYIDDLLVATPTFEKHITVLAAVFARLDAANVTLGAAKCHLAQARVHFLGHVVSADGILPNPAKVTAIEALALPNDKAGLETALGIMGYYRKFIFNYAAIAKTHCELRRKQVPTPGAKAVTASSLGDRCLHSTPRRAHKRLHLEAPELEPPV